MHTHDACYPRTPAPGTTSATPVAPTTATRRPRERYAVKGKAVRWIHTITTD